MSSAANPADRRQAQRRLVNRMAKIQFGNGALSRDCRIADISTGGVRLHVEGFQVPDHFVLLLSGNDLTKACNYQVVWRLGQEIGAKFAGLVRRSELGARV
jgi:PilZ domain